MSKTSNFIDNGYISEVRLNKPNVKFCVKRKNENKSILSFNDVATDFTHKELEEFIKNMQLYYSRVIRRERTGLIDAEFSV